MLKLSYEDLIAERDSALERVIALSALTFSVNLIRAREVYHNS